MRRHIAAAVIAAALSSHAVAQNSAAAMLAPSPWTIGITLIKWAMQDREKVLYIEVTAEGSDLDDARRRAFRMAVERAVGTVISAESQTENSRLARDEIITYASGYVRDYQLTETNVLEDRTQVRMKVWVSPSKLANRLLNQSRADGAIEGGKISQQIESLQYERATGDRLLLSVLQDYPYRAFNVRVLPTQVVMDQNRNPTLKVTIDLSWNKDYIASLGTAVRAINQRKGCDRWLVPAHCNNAVRIQAGDSTAWMDDETAWHLMHREMVISKPALLVTIYHTSGAWMHKKCFGTNELDHMGWASWRHVDVDPGLIRVNSWRTQRLENDFFLGALNTKNMERVDVQIVRGKDCPS